MFRLTRHGLREMIVGTIVLALLAAGLGWIKWPLGLIVLPVWIWLLAFFRDPERAVPGEQHLMVSPADGKVTDIIQIENCDLVGGPAVRVGIFLSVFNVHVNRAPCDGKVISVVYKKGKFINAMSSSHASEQNEANTVVLADPMTSRPIAAVKQIVGLIARRIVCTASQGDVLQRGQRIGMIKFGSRTELYIPQWLGPVVKVSIGQKVRGAMDIIAVLGMPTAAVPAAVNADATAQGR